MSCNPPPNPLPPKPPPPPLQSTTKSTKIKPSPCKPQPDPASASSDLYANSSSSTGNRVLEKLWPCLQDLSMAPLAAAPTPSPPSAGAAAPAPPSSSSLYPPLQSPASVKSGGPRDGVAPPPPPEPFPAADASEMVALAPSSPLVDARRSQGFVAVLSPPTMTSGSTAVATTSVGRTHAGSAGSGAPAPPRDPRPPATPTPRPNAAAAAANVSSPGLQGRHGAAPMMEEQQVVAEALAVVKDVIEGEDEDEDSDNDDGGDAVEASPSTSPPSRLSLDAAPFYPCGASEGRTKSRRWADNGLHDDSDDEPPPMPSPTPYLDVLCKLLPRGPSPAAVPVPSQATALEGGPCGGRTLAKRAHCDPPAPGEGSAGGAVRAAGVAARRVRHIATWKNILDKIPEDTLTWKMKQIKRAASYANYRLQSVQAEVLLLVSCADRLLPSKDEGDRLQKLLPKCKIYFFEKHGHSLLLEYGVHVASIIKCTDLYRHSRRYHRVFDYIPPSATELKEVDKATCDLRFRTCPAMYSTLEDGTVVRGLAGVPQDGPVLLVGNHMLLGIELISLAAEFLRLKRVVVRGIAHPLLFPNKKRAWSEGHDFFDFLNLWGGVPMMYKSIYDLLGAGEFVLLYPGGHREALHCKGEEHRLFWPTQTEFVRLATQFNATIVPFGVVGEDDLLELLCTFEDIRNAPFGKEMIQAYSNHLKLRDVDHEVFFPGLYLKMPGRFYYQFGKPIPTRGRQDVLTDKQAAHDLYMHVKSEVERIISYLLEKRVEDKYRSLIPRMLFQAARGPTCEVPAFDP